MFLTLSGTVQKLCGQSWGFYCIFFWSASLMMILITNIDIWMWVSSAEVYFQTQVQSASGLIPHPLLLIFDKPNQLRLLDWSVVSFNYYYSPTLRITGGSDLVCLLSICPHSSLLFHLDFVAAVVFVAVVFAIVTIFGTNCLDPLSLWHCSFSNWIINSSMIWVIIAKSCAYIQNRRNDSCWPLKI